MKFIRIPLVIFILIYVCSCSTRSKENELWQIAKAEKWQSKYGWLRGSNFIPSTAINQLEMWQEDTFDPVTIDRELGWAESIGFNAMRIYLHHLAWQQDTEGFIDRMDQYLDIAEKHKISTIFVIFDDCWNPTYHAGKQPEPRPGIHNSGWIQDPGPTIHTDTSLYEILEEYVKNVLNHFTKDDSIVGFI